MLTRTHETCILFVSTRNVSEGGEKVNTKEIGKILVNLRGEKSQKEVATALGISISALSMYETGERVPRDSIKIRISAYYNKPIQEIFYPETTRNVSKG